MERTYLNPVYPHSCPDPFVLKYCGAYWCYFTGLQADRRAFGILHSPDLVHWQPLGSALDPLPGEHPCYWAPEVVYQDGLFYLYYSVGDEEHMHIRVATSPHPAGPFVDSGRRLTTEKFAIDAHVFIDDDNSWYLFYAADFLDLERVGTGTVMDRLLDPFTLAGRPRPVTRARYDWQIYDPQRVEKGGVCWHTLEGPFVLKRHGRYYQMFSGGNWKNDTYGVSYAVTKSLDQPGEWEQACDGLHTLPLLRSVPALGVIGPGHNSVVRGPDNRQLFCIYHRWQPQSEKRVLAIDRLGWEGDRLHVYGPTTTPQPAPVLPLVSGFERFRALSGRMLPGEDEWRLISGGDQVLAAMPAPLSAFLLEISLRAAGPEPGQLGLELLAQAGARLRFVLDTAQAESLLETPSGLFRQPFPAGFNPQAFHLLRLEITPTAAYLSLDGPRQAWSLPSIPAPHTLHLFSLHTPAAFAGFELSP